LTDLICTLIGLAIVGNGLPLNLKVDTGYSQLTKNHFALTELHLLFTKCPQSLTGCMFYINATTPLVNPDHLFLGTHQDNMTDMCKKGRHVTNPLKGETAVNSKLTDDQVKSIKKDTRLQRIIAAEYGVHQVLISRIKTGKAWVHV
jgi:hypothetical protein